MVSIVVVTMAASIVSESEDSFHEAVSFSLSRLRLSGASLKEEQLSAVKTVYEGQDVFVCLPTGYSKSLYYQMLPFLMEHKLGGNRAVLVVSPLVALMEDQLYGLKKRSVRSSILSYVALVANENIATVECLGRDNLILLCSGSPYHSKVVRCL